MPNRKKGSRGSRSPQTPHLVAAESEVEVEKEPEEAPEDPPIVPVLLGKALKDLRKRYTSSQEDFAGITNKSQSYVSAAERGKSGWDSVKEWSLAVKKVGGDPVDLLRLAVAHADEDEELREILTLWAAAPRHTRGAILILLREMAAARSEAR